MIWAAFPWRNLYNSQQWRPEFQALNCRTIMSLLAFLKTLYFFVKMEILVVAIVAAARMECAVKFTSFGSFQLLPRSSELTVP